MWGEEMGEGDKGDGDAALRGIWPCETVERKGERGRNASEGDLQCTFLLPELVLAQLLDVAPLLEVVTVLLQIVQIS